MKFFKGLEIYSIAINTYLDDSNVVYSQTVIGDSAYFVGNNLQTFLFETLYINDLELSNPFFDITLIKTAIINNVPTVKNSIFNNIVFYIDNRIIYGIFIINSIKTVYDLAFINNKFTKILYSNSGN